MEFIAPNKAAFVAEFGVNADVISWSTDGNVFNKMMNMVTYNRFAVAAEDLFGTGKWSDKFSGNTFYSSYYTGAYLGMTSYSANEWFEFTGGAHYNWQLTVANSGGGSTAVARVTGKGNFRSVNNWQLAFSDIEGKARTFNVYYAAVKGGRVLFMDDAGNPGNYKGFQLP